MIDIGTHFAYGEDPMNVRNLQDMIAFSLAVTGVLLGLYVGVWWAFVGGIVQMIEALRAPELDALGVALGLARLMFCVPLGCLAGAIFVVPAALLGKQSAPQPPVDYDEREPNYYDLEGRN